MLAIIAIAVNLIRGTPKFDSVVGLSTCEAASWLILIGFVIICIALTTYNVRTIFKQVALKDKLGKLHSSEEWMTPKNLPKMLAGSLISGFIG